MSSFLDYLRTISGGATNVELSKIAGVHKATVGRWGEGVPPTLDACRRLAHAYATPVVEVLVQAGLITREDARAREVRAPLSDYTPTALLLELQRRFDQLSQPTESIQSEEDPHPDDYDLAAGDVARPDDRPAD